MAANNIDLYCWRDDGITQVSLWIAPDGADAWKVNVRLPPGWAVNGEAKARHLITADGRAVELIRLDDDNKRVHARLGAEDITLWASLPDGPWPGTNTIDPCPTPRQEPCPGKRIGLEYAEVVEETIPTDGTEPTRHVLWRCTSEIATNDNGAPVLRIHSRHTYPVGDYGPDDVLAASTEFGELRQTARDVVVDSWRSMIYTGQARGVDDTLVRRFVGGPVR